MNNPFQPAVKHKSKLRLAITGAAGSGKTLSALRIASGIGGKIALIDTEAGSASKYAGRYGIQFDTIAMQNPNIDNIVKLLNLAVENGYDVVIIDSLSHAWQELLLEMDRLANSKYKGNSFRAWSEGTPKQQQLAKAIIGSPLHIIGTMRVKTEYVVEPNERGKAAPRKIGTSPEQGKGIEYEFDMLIEMDQYHCAYISKDRTGQYQDATIEKPDEAFGKDLAAWLSDGVEPKPMQGSPDVDQATPINIDITLESISGMVNELQANLIDRWDQPSRRKESYKKHLGTDSPIKCQDQAKLESYEKHMQAKLSEYIAAEKKAATEALKDFPATDADTYLAAINDCDTLTEICKIHDSIKREAK